MVRFLKFFINGFGFCAILLFFNCASFADATPKQRETFKNFFAQLSDLSQTNGLECVEKSLIEPEKKTACYLLLKDEPYYKEAFIIKFVLADNTHTFSTLVAYEGFNGFKMGSLVVKKNGRQIVYTHTFNGFFDDILTLTTLKNKITHLNYQKFNPQRVEFYSLDCRLGGSI